MKTEFEKDLEIDKYSLDAECLDQPRKFMEWSQDYADAVSEQDRADQKLEVVKAQVEMEARKNPESFGLEKVTDNSIKAAVTMSKKVMEAHEAWVMTKHQVNVLRAGREALEQRKTMLENLVKLFLSGYWADPKIKPEAKEALAEEGAEKQKQGLSKNPRLLKKK
jgi:hypothetical protein